MGTLKSERRHREHPYIPDTNRRIDCAPGLADIEKNLAAYTEQVEGRQTWLRSDPVKFAFAGGKNPIRHVISS